MKDGSDILGFDGLYESIASHPRREVKIKLPENESVRLDILATACRIKKIPVLKGDIVGYALFLLFDSMGTDQAQVLDEIARYSREMKDAETGKRPRATYINGNPITIRHDRK